MKIILHKFQEKALYSKKRVTACISGVSGGKTTIGALWTRMTAWKTLHPNGLITAPDYKIMRHSTLPKFLEMWAGIGTYKPKDDIFIYGNNRKIFFRSLHDPDAIEGIQDVGFIWADELGKCNLKSWINIQGRSSRTQAPIFGTTTPYSLNWLYKDVFKPFREGKLKNDVNIVQWTSQDNPYFPKEEYERQKLLMDERVFDMKFGGNFRKMTGLVFLDFGGDKNHCDPFIIDSNKYTIIAGVDWGFTNQFAIAVRAIHKSEKRDYQIAEFYRTHMTPSEKVSIAKEFQKKFKIKTFYCDNEDPAMIKEFNSAGLNSVACQKYPGSLRAIIEGHYDLIKNGWYKLFTGLCPHTEDEYESYHYPEDSAKEKNLSENQERLNDHLMTANMYATQMSADLRQNWFENTNFKLVKTHADLLHSGAFRKQENDWYNS